MCRRVLGAPLSAEARWSGRGRGRGLGRGGGGARGPGRAGGAAAARPLGQQQAVCGTFVSRFNRDARPAFVSTSCRYVVIPKSNNTSFTLFSNLNFAKVLKKISGVAVELHQQETSGELSQDIVFALIVS